MNHRKLVASLASALIALIIGAFLYLKFSSFPEATAPVVAAPAAAINTLAREGEMEVVHSEPKPFMGRLSQEAASPNEFSSNPPREPDEEEVLKLSGTYSIPEKERVEQLLAMFPRLSDDAKLLAMEHAAALIPDSDYLGYRGRLLQLAANAELRETIMHDALTRGEEVRLPSLLEMLRKPGDVEEQQEIREILEAYLDKDYGPNPAHWEEAVRKWVSDNTDAE